jgi:hypothetical protein
MGKSKSKGKGKGKGKGNRKLSEQEIADKLHRIQLEVGLIPGNAFDPTIDAIPAAKLLESELIGAHHLASCVLSCCCR